jgi:hypothetical protein
MPDEQPAKKPEEPFYDHSTELRPRRQVRWANNYWRWCPKANAVEYLVQSADEPSMNKNEPYFTVEECPDGFFQRQTLCLDHVWWMNPTATVEDIPVPSADEGTQHMSVFVLHMIPDNFDMGCEFEVQAALMPEGDEDPEWKNVTKREWPVKLDDQERHVYIRQRVAVMEVPESFHGKRIVVRL